MCKALEVSQSGYCKWKSAIISKRRLKMMQLKEQIATIYFSSKQRYGSPRITKQLFMKMSLNLNSNFYLHI